MIDFETFSQNLRGALKHLYDPDYLRRSSLAGLFGVADRYDTPALLQGILIKGIESLRPAQKTPPLPSEQQNYDVLLYRFIQQSSQEEVSHQLGISPRQLRRIQAFALEALSAALWKMYRLDQSDSAAAPVQADEPAAPVNQAAQDDFAWLRKAPVTDPANPEEVTQQSLGLLRPLAERHNIPLSYQIAAPLPALAVHPIALRQILLSLLGEMIRSGSGFDLTISIAQVRAEVGFTFRRNPARWDPPVDANSKGVLDAHQIALLSNGRLEWLEENGEASICLFLPAIDQVKVVVVDDNRDIIELMRRYLNGTRYVLIGVSRAFEVVDTVIREKPHIILLDVMIPELDGWELLGQLRRNPRTDSIPVIICSILAQEELALALGAVDFIQKPVQREILLQVLERVAAKWAREPS